MMKKFSGILLVMALGLASNAFAASTGAGCGLGKLLLDGESGRASNIIASILNSIGTQTFAMTSGTSGCDTNQVIQLEHQTKAYVANNLEPLSQEMAQGAGERLNVLAGLMGCPASVRGTFGEMTQARFESLPMVSGEESVPALVEALQSEIHADAILATACSPVS